MLDHHVAFFLSALTVVLTVLGITSERLATRLAWVGAAVFASTVGLWVLIGG